MNVFYLLSQVADVYFTYYMESECEKWLYLES